MLLQVAEQQAAAASKAAEELLAAEEKTRAQEAVKEASHNKAKPKAAAAKQPSDQASCLEEVDRAKAEAKKAKKQRQKAKKQSGQTVLAVQHQPATPSSAQQQSSGQAAAAQQQQPSQQLQADLAAGADKAQSSLLHSCTDGQPGGLHASPAQSKQIGGQGEVMVPADAAASPASNGLVATASEVAVAAPAWDAAEARTPGEGQAETGVAASLAAAPHAAPAAAAPAAAAHAAPAALACSTIEARMCGEGQAESVPPCSTASSDAAQQQHTYKQEQQATDAMLSTAPRLGELSPKTSAAGVLSSSKTSDDLLSIRSEQIHTSWETACPADAPARTADVTSGQTETKLSHNSSRSSAVMKSAVTSTLSKSAEQVSSAEGGSKQLLQGAVSVQHQQIRAVSQMPGTSNARSAATAGLTSPEKPVDVRADAEAAFVLTPYKPPAERGALMFHCPLTKVGI